MPAPPVGAAFDPTRSWRLHPQVALRPESFGALLYHFGTRKLSFLKNRTILAVIDSLDDHPDVAAALMAAGVDRMVMLLCGVQNLREITLFPMNQQAEDLLMGAPSPAMAKQLRELNIRVVEQPPKA